ncbi:NADP-dependent phosphogluconate dehydrogenase [Gymnodinialimonas sp. 2305UL16-5]|uniref:NADP-dependent phosphogluconate dehydrogenase n=1 Tax=Gymnodinialimonas mytili TaxID=3126503 RepID=UPI0030978BEE
MSDADIGLIGLGTMGAALALNIADNGFEVAVWNRTTARTQEFAKEAGPFLASQITPTETLKDLVAAIRAPRAIILMVPAGQPVDDQIAALAPLLSPGDLIIDAGNANFRDTNRRSAATGNIGFFGIGVSGGEEGARNGPSIMAGGDAAHWSRVETILTAIAADFQGSPCVAYLGPEGAGHFVKTVHNGIEYADMQMIAETYGLMRDGMEMTAPEIGNVFSGWNDGPLKSYLIEISATVARTQDAATNGPLLDVIVDAAGQKGTGRWTAIEAQHIAAPVPVIEAAVAARNLSARRDARAEMEALFGTGPVPLNGDITLDEMEQALTAGKILCYSQGFGMIAAASNEFGWDLSLPDVARVWREGCIIRSAMLDDMAAALSDDPKRALMAAPVFAEILAETHVALRKVVGAAVAHGIAVPALSSGLAYFDTMRTARGTANMIQGQRDYFGLHGFERLDDGSSGQHGPWAV